MAKVTRTRNTKETGMSYPTVITIASLFSGEMEKIAVDRWFNF